MAGLQTVPLSWPFGTFGTETSSVNRTFDDANQLLVSTDTELGTTSFYYDGNGNLVQILPPGINPGEAGEQLYTFDQRNLITQYRVGAGGSVYDTVAEYVYDGDSNRLQQRVDGITTTFTLDLSGALAQVLAQTPQTVEGVPTYFVPGTGGQQTQGVWSYLHVDGLGSVRQITDVAGGVVGEMRYSPFGEIEAMSGLPAMFGYTGEQQGGTNNLVYLRARYYNPALGRFLTQDSLIPDVTNGQALNAYAYVYNDPVNLVDPSGNIPSLPSRQDIRDGTRRGFEKGLDFIDNWYSQPEDCNCGNGLPQSALNYTEGLNKNMANPAAQLALGVYTSPARKIASRVDVYSRWPASTSFGRVSVDKYFGTYRNVDITDLRTTNYAKIAGVSGNSSTVVRMGDGRKVLIHNSKTRTTVGPKGLISSIIGAGLIDAAFQLYNDWAQGLCLSPNQYFWRANVALLFGFGAGVVGAAAVVLLVAAGAPAIVAGLAGFGVSAGIGYAFDHFGIKPNLINDVSDAAGRW